MNDEMRTRADARLEQALEAHDVRDPRGYYRDWLRALRERDVTAFDAARRHYEEVLLPRVAAGDVDPVAEWLGYGERLAALSGAGRLLEVDESGRARTATSPLPPGRLVLFLPDEPREPARIVSLPRAPSQAQRATCDLLVEGRVTLREEVH